MLSFHPTYPLYILIGLVLLTFPVIFWYLKQILKSSKQINREATQASLLHRYSMATDEFEKAGKDF